MFNLKMTTANTHEKKLAGQQRTRPNMGKVKPPCRYKHNKSCIQSSSKSHWDIVLISEGLAVDFEFLLLFLRSFAD